MAVLLEDFSVVVRRSAINERYRGGVKEFLKHAPKLSLCYDRTLVRVAFLHPNWARRFAAELEAAGLIHRRDGKSIDFAMINDVKGPPILEGVEREYLPAAMLWAEADSNHLARSHFVVGVIWTILGRDFEAEQAIREALRIDPEDITTLLETARCLDRQGKATEAMTYAADRVVVAPNMAEASDLVAICYLKCDAVGRRQSARLQNLSTAEAANLTEAIRSLFVKFTDREQESHG